MQTDKTIWIIALFKNYLKTMYRPPQHIVWSYAQWQPMCLEMIDIISGVTLYESILPETDSRDFLVLTNLTWLFLTVLWRSPREKDG